MWRAVQVRGSEGDTELGIGALERILEVTRALARPLELEAMLEQIVDAGRQILSADRGTVFLYESETEELVSKVATGSGELRVPASAGIVGECARTRSVVNVPDCYADPRFNPEVDRQTGYRTRCMMTLPLIGHDESLEGVLQVLNKDGGVFSAEDEQIATALGAQCAVALQRTRLLGDLVVKERMEQELLVARRIQMRVFPQVMPKIEGYDICGWCRTADETGGDIFDLIQTGDGKLRLLLGDATGHGIGPALSVTQVRAMLRMCVRFGADIPAATRYINNQLEEDLSANRFVTAFLGDLDAAKHRIDYHSAGQAPLLHLAANGEPNWLDSTLLPLGIMEQPAVKPAQAIDLGPGDQLVLATDGIFEYEDPSGEQYGEERVVELLRADPAATASERIERLVAEIERHARGARQADDMTILIVRRLPA